MYITELVLAAIFGGAITVFFQQLRSAFRRKGRHRRAETLGPELVAEDEWDAPTLTEIGEPVALPLLTAPLPTGADYYPPLYPEPVYDPPRDEYLDKFDALVLASRAQFAAIRRNVGLPELEPA